MYEHIKDYIIDVIGSKYIGTGMIAVLGGIQINVAHNADWFEPATFFVMDKDGVKDYTERLWDFDLSVEGVQSPSSGYEVPPVMQQQKSTQPVHVLV
jgi:hypothetical protein